MTYTLHSVFGTRSASPPAEGRPLGVRYARWWTDGLPPLSGPLRFVFYGLLFVQALRNPISPLRGIEYYSITAPELYRTYGLFDVLGIGYIDPVFLQPVVWVVGTAWVCAAIGLWTRPAMIVTAVGAAFLHGLFLSTNALNHYWFLSIYAFALLCFARTDDNWSVDALIRRWRGRPPPTTSRSTLAATGFARQAFLVATVGFYFSAGVSKLRESGLRWADGHTIEFFIALRGQETLLGSHVLEYSALFGVLGTIALFVEVGSPLALLSRRLRLLFVLGWASMHLGIKLMMGPSYSQNVVCYVLQSEWSNVGAWLRARSALAREWLERWRTLVAFTPPGRLTSRASLRGRVAGTVLLVLCASVSLGQVFWWPLTNVYMYCAYFSTERGYLSSVPADRFDDPVKLQALARTYEETGPPIETMEWLAYLPEFRLRSAAGADTLSVPPGMATEKQWRLTVLQDVLVADLVSKPEGNLAVDPARPDLPAQALLLRLRPILRERLSAEALASYTHAELVYPLADGEVVLASVPLNEAEPR
ncbi:MAG: hypothetical protein AAFX41_09200 [Bacteroidota bacterium]